MLRNGLPKSKESDPVESQFRLPYQFADSLQFVSVTNGEVSLFLYLGKGSVRTASAISTRDDSVSLSMAAALST